MLCRRSSNPGPRHIQYIKHLVRLFQYSEKDRLISHMSDGPTYINTMTDILQLRFQCDADLAENDDSKYSQTSLVSYSGGSLICWCSTDQGSVSTSTAESEIKAVYHALRREVIANRGILTIMGWTHQRMLCCLLLLHLFFESNPSSLRCLYWLSPIPLMCD